MTIQTIRRDGFPSKVPQFVFLDSGGVINDNVSRAPQWLKYLGEFLPQTRLQGSSQLWIAANTSVVKIFFRHWYDYMQEATELASKNEQNSEHSQETNVQTLFERIHMTAWMKLMCEHVTLQDPTWGQRLEKLALTDQELYDIAKAAHRFTIARVRAPFPGAVECLQNLHVARGVDPLDKSSRYRLFTSSGDALEDLEVTLSGIGAKDYFEEVNGADTLNCLKNSGKFYQRLFAKVGIRPVRRLPSDLGDALKEEDHQVSLDPAAKYGAQEILVLDDSPKVLKWARSLGAWTVLVTSADEPLDLEAEGNRHIDFQIRGLADLPALLDSIRDHPTTVSASTV
ncbi:hypothetical protein BGW38_007066 [Lunasporangiospora selenospora]|uniref:Uncharacterized protein n=1 Tax=Lunasporangiospora selenospora TaxID=979761 RepID=A0A9P6FZF1_9FUNG|nr:hypothetical protein BGW38_007066 [Lunasporangiospora selenospora]